MMRWRGWTGHQAGLNVPNRRKDYSITGSLKTIALFIIYNYFICIIPPHGQLKQRNSYYSYCRNFWKATWYTWVYFAKMKEMKSNFPTFHTDNETGNIYGEFLRFGVFCIASSDCCSGGVTTDTQGNMRIIYPRRRVEIICFNHSLAKK